MSTETLLRQAVKGALAFGAAGGMVGAGVALAQTAAPASGTASGATNLSKIVVTGSHIPQTSVATAQPVITISRQEIDASGFTTTGQLLQNLPSAQGALNVQFNNGGNGATFINLHGLGSQRVLVLVDGQRWIPTLAGNVDISTIPLAAVDHVEVLLNGAAAVYGSEAIAGVINIVTKKNYNGAEASAYVGIMDGSKDGGGWDNKTQNYSFTVGTAGDRSSVLLSAGYYTQNPVWAGQRSISKEPVIGTGNTHGSSGTPGGRFLMLTWGQFPTTPGCSSYPGVGGYCDIAGPINGPNANPHPWSSNDPYNYAPLNYLLTPSERWYTYSQGHYDLTDNITFSFKTTYNRRNSHQLLAPNPWFMGPFGGLKADGLYIGVSATNPYNPFGVDLIPAYYPSTATGQAWCSKYGTGGGGTCTAQYDSFLFSGLRPLKAGFRDFNQNVQTFYFNGGFDGFWTMFGNQWSWNANYIYGQTTDTTVTTGLTSTTRMQKALGPLSQCQGAADGCVPLDIFGGPAGMTAEQINYISFTAHDITKTVVRDYNAGFAGSFWNSWYAGPWQMAAGYEYEETDGYFQPDPLIAAGNTVGNAAKPTSGRINTNSEYGELVIPFASNLPFAKEISLDIANRWSQFKWNGNGNVLQPNGTVLVQPAGGAAHASTGRATLKWRPVEQLLLRGSWSQGFRAPSLTELFSGVGDNFPGLVDPCAPTYGGTGGRNCPPVPHVQPNPQIHTSIGGSANLQPERSITKSAGFVYSPTWAPGLDFSADYYDTKIVQTIGRQGGQYYLNTCYAPGPKTPQSTIDAACARIVAPGKVVTNILDLVNNGGVEKVRGWDTSIKYRLPTTAAGNFSFNLSMNFLQSQVFCSATGVCQDVSGTVNAPSAFFAQPKHRYNLGMNWDYGPWAATWNVSLIGQVWEDCGYGTGAPGFCSNPEKYNGPGNQSGQNHLGTTIYHDVQASYTLASWNTTFSIGILNLFDKNPPISHDAFANSFLPVFYRTPGRFWYGRISVKF